MVGPRIVLLEGLFYISDEDGFYVQTDNDSKPASVKEYLKPLIGEDVLFVAHHHPKEPLDESRWGGGCCMWENTQACPAGHHENRAFLFNFSENGVLQCDDGGWSIGGRYVNFGMLNGHYSRLVAITKFDAGSFSSVLDVESIDDLSNHAEQMKDMISGLKDFLNQMKGS